MHLSKINKIKSRKQKMIKELIKFKECRVCGKRLEETKHLEISYDAIRLEGICWNCCQLNKGLNVVVVKDIETKNLPIDKSTAMLFVWVTSKNLVKAFDIVKTWESKWKYCTNFVIWIPKGMGEKKEFWIGEDRHTLCYIFRRIEKQTKKTIKLVKIPRFLRNVSSILEANTIKERDKIVIDKLKRLLGKVEIRIIDTLPSTPLDNGLFITEESDNGSKK